MDKNLHSRFNNYCGNSMTCEVCSLYFLSDELKISCEELFQYLSEKYQFGVVKENENE